MPFLKKAEIMPVKGVSFAVPSTFLPEGLHFPANMRYHRAELTSRDGRSELGNQTAGASPVLHVAVMETSTGLQYLFRHTATEVEYYNSSTGAWQDKTPVAKYTGALSDLYDSAVVAEDDTYVFTNYVDNVQEIDINLGVAEDLGGSPPKAKYVEYVTPYLLLANVEESGTAIPTKVIWSGTGDITQWTGGNTGSQLLTDDESEIRGLKKMRDLVFVYKENSVYKGRKVSTSDVFDFGGPFSVGRGAYSGRTVVDANSVHFYMGLSDFYANDGIRITPIGAPVREYIFNRLDRTNYANCFAIHVEALKEIWYFIAVSNNTWPTEVWKYKYDLDFWYYDDIEKACSGTNYKIVTARAWDDVTTTWDNSPNDWDFRGGVANAPVHLVGTRDGNVLYEDSSRVDDNGTYHTAKFETSDYSGVKTGSLELDTRFLQVDAWLKGTAVDVSYSTDFGSTWTFIRTVSLDESYQKHTLYFDIIAKRIRFKFESASSGDFFSINAFQPYYLSRGEDPNDNS